MMCPEHLCTLGGCLAWMRMFNVTVWLCRQCREHKNFCVRKN